MALEAPKVEADDLAGELGDRLHTFHNLSQENLRHADRMGGMPMPSIGIGRVDTPVDSYGDITLIGPQDMARPSARNPVYSSDAYTPTYPRIDYKHDRKAIKTLENDLDPYHNLGEGALYADDLDPRTLMGRDDVKALYLAEQGIELPDLKGFELNKWIRDKVNEVGRENYEGFAQSMFDSLNPEERIFFGYTNAGNRRYKPHTLDNTVKYMKEEMTDNNQTSMFGAGALRAQVAPQFRKLSDVQGARDRILPADALDKGDLNNRLFEVSAPFSEYAKYTDSNQFIAADLHREQLLEIAQGRATYDEYFPGAPQEAIANWEQYLEDLKAAPTNYFEAKPQRAVGLDEFSGALIPADAPQEIEDMLRRNRIDRIERVTDEADRIAKMRKFQDLLFGIGGVSTAGILATGGQDQSNQRQL
jgi:hypothetical protein